MNNSSICIATPMYGGMCTGSYASSLLMLGQELNRVGINFSFTTISDSLVTRGRNHLVNSFLEHTDSTNLIFIDGDIQFQPSDIVSMLEANLDIIAGDYPLKMISWERVRLAALDGIEADELPAYASMPVTRLIGWEKDLPEDINEPVEIKYCGTGFMLIKRSVFERLESKVPVFLSNTLAGLINNGHPVREYFSTSIDSESGELLGEDYNFCQLARNNGIKVHLARWVQLKHVGYYSYGG